MTVSRNFKIGILVVLSFLLFFIGFNFLKTFETFGEVREFTVEFEQTQGLQVNDVVLVHGVQVGHVTYIDLHPKDAKRVLVRFSVEDDDIDIPRESQLWLISSDILGTKAIDLRIPSDSAIKNPDDVYKDGDWFDPDYVNIALAMDDEFAAQFIPIKEKTEELIKRVEDIIFKVSSYWDNSGAYAFDASMYDVRDAIDRYKEMTINLTELVKRETYQASLITSDIKDLQEFFHNDSALLVDISTNFKDISVSLNDTALINSFKRTSGTFTELDETFRWVNKGNGTVGLFTSTDSMKNQIAQIDTAFQNLKWHLSARAKDFVGFSIFGLKAEGYQPDKNKEPYLDATLDSLRDGKKIDYK